MRAINGIEAVELLASADPALAAAARQRGRVPVFERTAGTPSVQNGIEGVIWGTSASGPGTVLRLDSADPDLARQARQRGQRAVVVVDSTGAVVTSEAWYEAGTSYDALAAVMDFNNDRYALPAYGSELVTNGTFDTDTTGWEAKFDGAISFSSGRIRITANGGATQPRALQTLSGLMIGKFYQASATYAAQSASLNTQLFIGIASSGSTTGAIATSTSGTALRTDTIYFTATQTTHYVGLLHASIVAAGWSEFDNVSVKEVILTATGRTYGSELVVNGDFATGPTLGSELLDNGDFSGAAVASPNFSTGWVLKTPAAGTETMTISGGTLNLTGDGTNYAYADQSFDTTPGQLYALTFTISASLQINIGTVQGGTQYKQFAPTGAGTHTTYFVATGATAWLRPNRNTASLATVDDVTVKSVSNQAAVGWLPGSGNGAAISTISGGTLNLTGDGTNVAYADQSFTTVNGQVYEVVFTTHANGVGCHIGTSQGGSQLSAFAGAAAPATYKFQATGTTTWVRFYRLTASLSTVDNVSIRALTAIGTYPKREATFDECFAYTAASDVARTYTDVNGVLKNDLAVNARRMTYANAKRQLRLENAGTNILTYSDTLNNAAWAAENATLASVANGWWELREDAATNYHRILRGTTTGTATVGAAYTLSTVVRKAGRRYIWFRSDLAVSGTQRQVGFDLDTVTTTFVGSGFTAVITALPGGAFLLQATATVTAVTTNRSWSMGSSNASVASDTIPSFAGDIAQGVDIRYMQAEVNAFATDYIPTTTAAVTRAIETARLSPLLEAVLQRAQGSVVVRVDLTNTNSAVSRRFVGATGGTYLLGTGAATQTLLTANAPTQLTATLGSGNYTDALGGASGFDAAGRSLVGNGGTVATDAVASPARTTVYLARDADNTSGGYGDGYYDLLGISPERLPNTDLQSLAVVA